MKVKITEHTIAQRKQVAPGDELDVSKEEAGILIGAKKAIALSAPVEKAVLPAAETTEGPKPEKPKPAQPDKPSSSGSKEKTPDKLASKKPKPPQVKKPSPSGSKEKVVDVSVSQADDPARETNKEQTDGIP